MEMEISVVRDSYFYNGILEFYFKSTVQRQEYRFPFFTNIHLHIYRDMLLPYTHPFIPTEVP